METVSWITVEAEKKFVSKLYDKMMKMEKKGPAEWVLIYRRHQCRYGEATHAFSRWWKNALNPLCPGEILMRQRQRQSSRIIVLFLERNFTITSVIYGSL